MINSLIFVQGFACTNGECIPENWSKLRKVLFTKCNFSFHTCKPISSHFDPSLRLLR